MNQVLISVKNKNNAKKIFFTSIFYLKDFFIPIIFPISNTGIYILKFYSVIERRNCPTLALSIYDPRTGSMLVAYSLNFSAYCPFAKNGTSELV